MYSLEKVTNYCRKVFENVGYDFDNSRIKVVINKRLTRTHGKCIGKYDFNDVFYPYELQFSALLLETATDESIEEVIKHECCHALVDLETGEHHGHDKIFKEMCQRVGCNFDKSKSNVERTIEESKIYKYTVYCKNCGKPVSYYMRAGNVVKHPENYASKCCRDGLEVRQNF
jgi:predicted SprT family Zn-dependent metalloprotease